jgi:hypothetical protein
VSDGNAWAHAEIVATDAKGRKVFTQADANGAFWLSYAGKQFPLTLVATDASGRGAPLVAVLPGAGIDASQPLQANINTLTTAQAALLTPSGNPLDLVDVVQAAGWVTPATVAQANSTLNAMLYAILQREALDPAAFDPTHLPDTSDHVGLDAVLADVALSGTNHLTLASTADPARTLSLSIAATVPAAPLAAPPVRANYLDSVQSAFQNAVPQSASLTPTPVERSETTWLAHRSDVALERPRTERFATTTDGRLSASVKVPYRLASGQYRQVSVTALRLVDQGGVRWMIPAAPPSIEADAAADSRAAR